MRAHKLVCLVLAIAGCSSASTPAESTTTTDAAPDTASSLLCEPTGGLTPPAAGQAVMNVTFSEPLDGYNGSLDAFTGTAIYCSTDPDAARFICYNKQLSPGDDTLRQLMIAVGPLPTACQTLKTGNAPAAAYPYIEYYEGPMLRKQFVCGGTVIVDAVVGDSYTFHFEARCLKKPVLEGAGSVKIVGKGAGTRKPRA